MNKSKLLLSPFVFFWNFLLFTLTFFSLSSLHTNTSCFMILHFLILLFFASLLSITLMPMAEHYQDGCCSLMDREPGAKSGTLLARSCPSICPWQHPHVSVKPHMIKDYHYSQLLIPICSLGCICCLYPVMVHSEGKVCELCLLYCSSTHIFTAFPATTSLATIPPELSLLPFLLHCSKSPNPSYPLLPSVLTCVSISVMQISKGLLLSEVTHF